MCELFAISSRQPKNIRPYLIEFFSHSTYHPDGWGIAEIHKDHTSIHNEALSANDSPLLPHLLKDLSNQRQFLAHIRKATVGYTNINNTHPFSTYDDSGKKWTLIHNGTIFHSEELTKYQKSQRGDTDSERILLYLVDVINNTKKSLFPVLKETVKELSINNKLNLVFTDGEYMFIHTNMKDTLYYKYLEDESILISTTPLDGNDWHHVPLNQLIVLRHGDIIYRGTPHSHTYVPEYDYLLDENNITKHHTYVPESYLDQAIYNKYFIPTQREPQSFVGIEFEFPIVNLKRKPVDFELIHDITYEFIDHFHFDHVKYDDEGYIYTAFSSSNGDDISYDCSYNTLEFSFGKDKNMNDIYERFASYYTFIQERLELKHHSLTGMGVNPYRKFNLNLPLPSERYRMLFHHLYSYKKYQGHFHDYPMFGLFSCASQVQLDVGQDSIVDTLNANNLLEPFKSLLFANSYMEDEELLISRDMLWRDSLHGYNPHNVDLYQYQFSNNQDIINYIKSMSLYCVERGGKYIHFPPTTLREYFSKDSMVGEYYDGENYRSITFTPLLEDLQFLRSFKFEDLTFRGTIEYRSICEQPISSIMAPAAFQTGLHTHSLELLDILNNDYSLYHNGYNTYELRNMCNKSYIPEFVNIPLLQETLYKILDLSKQGLIERGLEEEHFLEPLYERVELLTNPAKDMYEGLRSGQSLEYYIEKYGKI